MCPLSRCGKVAAAEFGSVLVPFEQGSWASMHSWWGALLQISFIWIVLPARGAASPVAGLQLSEETLPVS